ncbi:MAG: hypothetical protein JXB07_01470 [Anaerolineae bacterium]|nr:hypothetical protein [Anaerolineae bacterium]
MASIEQVYEVVLPTSYSGTLPDGAAAVLGLGAISASVSPDGMYFIIWSESEALLYDFATLKPLWDQARPGGAVTWLLGGNHVAVGRNVWDIRTGNLVFSSPVALWSASKWSPDGTVIATPGSESSIVLFDAQSGQEIHRLELPESLQAELPSDVPTYNQIDISFSPNAEFIGATYGWFITGDYNGCGGALVVWSVPTGHLMHTLSPSSCWIGSISWSPNNSMVSTAAGGRYLWDVKAGVLLKEIADANSITWSPDGSRFATAINVIHAGEKSGAPIRVWNSMILEEEYSINKSNDAILWSPDSSRMITTGYDDMVMRIIVHDAATGTELLSIPNSDQPFGLSANNNRFIGNQYFSYDASDYDNTLVAWSIDGNVAKQALTFRGTLPIVSIAWSPDGRLIAGGMGWNYGFGLAIWDAATTRSQAMLDKEALGLSRWSRLVDMDWSPDGSTLAMSLSADAGVVVDVDNQSTRRDGASGLVMYSPDGTMLANAQENQASVWSALTGNNIQTFTLEGTVINALAWSSDGTHIAFATMAEDAIWYNGYYHPGGEPATGEILVWDIQSNEIITTLRGVLGVPYSLDWSPDGNQIAGGFDADIVGVWNVASGTLVRWLYGNVDPNSEMAYVSLDWSPNSAYIAAAYGKNPFFRDCNGCGYGRPGKVILWDAATGTRLRRYTAHYDEVQAVAFSPDSLLLASGSLDGRIILWNMDSQ